MWAGRCCGPAELEYYVNINWYGVRSLLYAHQSSESRLDYTV